MIYMENRVRGGKNMNLKISIEKKYRQNLEKRFDISNIVKKDRYFALEDDCLLCQEFGKSKCNDCPFKIYETKEEYGCKAWIRMVIGKSIKLVWHNNEHLEMQNALKEIVKRGKELISWT